MQEKKADPVFGVQIKPKLIFIIPSLQVGGAEKVMLSLAQAFQRRSYDTELWSLDPHGPLTKDAAGLQGNTNPSNIPLRPKTIRLLKNMFLIALHLSRRTGPTVIVSSVSGTNIFACILKTFVAKNIVLIIREATTIKNYRSRWKFRLARKFYRNADRIVAVSEEVREDLVYNMKITKEQVIVINNPVDKDRAQTLSDKALPVPLPTDKKIVLYVGRMRPEKGPDVLLKAFAICKRKSDTILIMVGSGPEFHTLQKLALKLGISEQVNFVGHMENPFPFFKHAHLFVLPSRWEGFVNVLLEAMAVGVPNIIASNCRGGPEEILCHGKYGTLVPSGDVEALAQAMDTTLDNLRIASTYDISAYQPENVFLAYEKLIIDALANT